MRANNEPRKMSFGNDNNNNCIEKSQESASTAGTQENDFDRNPVTNRSYDAAFKSFFSRKSVLAIILHGVVPEFKNMHPSEIENYIISSDTNEENAEKYSEEDVTYGSKILYDVVAKCNLPHKELDDIEQIQLSIVIDLEMQRKYNMTYDILDRATYYASRQLAKQVVVKSHYEKLHPVYSIWICLTGIPKQLQNTVHQLRLTDSSTTNCINERSLINVDLLLLSEKYDWDITDDETIKFLQAVFNDKLRDQSFNPYLKINPGIEKEVNIMTNWQEQYNLEIETERMQAEARGKAIGEAQGEARGKAIGIIEMKLDSGIRDKNDIIETIVRLTDYNETDATEFVNDYLNKH